VLPWLVEGWIAGTDREVPVCEVVPTHPDQAPVVYPERTEWAGWTPAGPAAPVRDPTMVLRLVEAARPVRPGDVLPRAARTLVGRTSRPATLSRAIMAVRRLVKGQDGQPGHVEYDAVECVFIQVVGDDWLSLWQDEKRIMNYVVVNGVITAVDARTVNKRAAEND
jgi:hypothetical protein